MYKTRLLQQSDFDALYQFLLPRQFLCMHMCSNCISEGLEYSGRRFSGTYAAAFLVQNSDSNTNDSTTTTNANPAATTESIAAVVCLCWNGMVLHLCDSIDALMQSDLVSLCVKSAQRDVSGLAGSPRGCAEIARMLGLEHAETILDEDEGLYLLNMTELTLPEKLREDDSHNATPGYITRFPLEFELPQIVAYRVAFQTETLGKEDTEQNRAMAVEAASTSHRNKRHFVLVDRTNNNSDNRVDVMTNNASDGGIVMSAIDDGGGSNLVTCNIYSFLGFSAVTPNCVNVGPVYTPREFRCKGYAKRLLYGSLCYARDFMNATQATLIANDPAAVSAYLSVGFKLYGQSKFILYKPK
jgi:hypothetical protein